MVLVGLLVQPLCALHTRTIMRHAAAEAVRVATTAADDQTVRSFALRRLAAVPEASPFHVGGQGDWTVTVERSDAGRRVAVRVSGHLKPLPLLGLLASWVGEPDGEGIRLEVCVRERVRPAWWMPCGRPASWERGEG